MTRVYLMIVLLSIALFTAACANTPADPTAAPTAEVENDMNAVSVATEPVEAPTETEVITEAAAAPTATEIVTEAAAPAETVSERPAWQTMELTDARTGETFTLADFEGRTVLVEPMATWCTNCRAQLRRVAEVREQLGEEDYVFIALSVEQNITAADLASYTERQGFDWPFALLDNATLQSLVDTFNRSITTPPSTPHFIIRPDGSFTDLFTGAKSVEDLTALLTAESQV
jgi:thiol-disulfide isomerase/thioredoxin